MATTAGRLTDSATWLVAKSDRPLPVTSTGDGVRPLTATLNLKLAVVTGVPERCLTALAGFGTAPAEPTRPTAAPAPSTPTTPTQANHLYVLPFGIGFPQSAWRPPDREPRKSVHTGSSNGA